MKSFVDVHEARHARKQAAQYAADLGLGEVNVVLFVRVEDDAVLAELSTKEVSGAVRVGLDRRFIRASREPGRSAWRKISDFWPPVRSAAWKSHEESAGCRFLAAN